MVAKPNKPLTDKQIARLMETSELEWGKLFPRHSIHHLRKIKRELRAPEAAKRETEKQGVINDCAKFITRHGRMPKQAEMSKRTVVESQVKRHFGGLKDLESHMRDRHPELFPDAPSEVFAPPKFKRTKLKSKHHRFFLTSAVVGADVDPGMLKAIDEYCNARNAEPIILPSADPAARVSPNGRGYFDSALKPYGFLKDELQVNSNLFLSNIELSAKQIDPSTGLDRIGQRDGSFVYASAKQRLKYTPTSNERMPHAIMTTGACTMPAYDPYEHRSLRLAYIATHDHVMGGVVVDVQDDRIFHFRQMQADQSGGLVDLGKHYSADGVRDLECEAMVPGDWHVTETDPAVRKMVAEVHDLVKPRRVYLHDVFSGVSCNHWERNNKITRAMDAAEGKLSIQGEVEAVAEEMASLKAKGWDLNIVHSNHHAFLYKYLERAWYTDEPWNKRYALYLAMLLCDGLNPLEHECERLAPGAARWLPHDREIDERIEGIHVSAHGHIGPNGARGSIQGLERSYGMVMYGHEHTAQILRGATCVGTSTPLRLRFNAHGPSSWTQTLGLIFKGGFRQLVNSINGEWR